MGVGVDLKGERGSAEGAHTTEGPEDQAGAKLRERERKYRHDEGMEKGVRLVLPSCP